MRSDELPLQYDLWSHLAHRAYLLRLLREAGGNQCKAALLAGVHRNTISRLLKAANIGREEISLIQSMPRSKNGDPVCHPPQVHLSRSSIEASRSSS